MAWAGVFAFAAIAALAAASAAWIASAAAAALAAVAALAAMSWLRPVRLVAPDIGPALRELKEAARALGLEGRPTRADAPRKRGG